MNTEEALRLLREETSERAIYKLRIEGKTPKEIMIKINEAIEMVCDIAEKYMKEHRPYTDEEMIKNLKAELDLD